MISTETRFDAVNSSLAALKAVNDPAVQEEAKKLEKNIKAIIDINKPMVVNYAEQLKAFDAGLITKYGVPLARLVEFGMVAMVAAKLFLVG